MDIEKLKDGQMIVLLEPDGKRQPTAWMRKRWSTALKAYLLGGEMYRAEDIIEATEEDLNYVLWAEEKRHREVLEGIMTAWKLAKGENYDA